jgi:hypothetical protein
MKQTASSLSNGIKIGNILFQAGENECHVYYEARVRDLTFCILQPKGATKKYWAVIVRNRRGWMRPLNTAILNPDRTIKTADPLYVGGAVDPDRDYWLKRVAEFIESGVDPFRC